MIALNINGGQTEFEPGELIEVETSWELNFVPKSIELRIGWTTRGKGDQDSDVVQTIPLDKPSRAEARLIPLSLPASPYSFSGRIVSLVWSIELIAKPGKETCSTEIVIAPGGHEVVLHRADSHESA